jgi:cardiolipin synthase
VVVRDAPFAQDLADRLQTAMAQSEEAVQAPRRGWRQWLHRGLVAWCANVYLRLAGITGRY